MQAIFLFHSFQMSTSASFVAILNLVLDFGYIMVIEK